ncbi:MAG: AI-2E family transporter [Candidatus Omnitrophica bacterium]|nr:AI-2E family transporter [Candidatus Omnitrophota bacterium]
MKQEQIVSYFFLGLFLFIVYQILLIFSPFIAAGSWAVILAFAFYPVYRRIQNVPKINRSLAALSTTAFVILIFVLPAAIILISLMQEAIDLYYELNNFLRLGGLERLVEQAQQQMANSEWAQKLWLFWNPLQKDASEVLLQGAKGIGNFAALQLAQLTKNVFIWILNLILIAFLLFFFFRDGETIYNFIYKLIPMAKKNKEIISERINETLAAVIRGQFLTCIVQGTIAGFTFWILGLPLPFFFGFLTFLTAMIPITGAATVWFPFALYLFLDQQMEKGIALAIIGIFGISLSDNILKPLLVGEKTKLPIFLLFLGILGSMKVYGFAGIFLGPVVLAIFFVLAKIYREEYHPAER